MKNNFVLIAFAFIILSSLKLLAVSDTAWTLTLPSEQNIWFAFFSEDDSLLIARIANPYTDSIGYIQYFNSYTGESKRITYMNNQIGWVSQMAISYIDTLLATYSHDSFDTVGGRKYEFNIKFINYKTGLVVDSIIAGNDPDLNPDTSEVVQLEFTPDGTKLYGLVKIIDSYNQGGSPIYKEKLFVWDVATGQLIRKYRPNFDYNRTFRIAPNNKYYVRNSFPAGGCVNFMNLNDDSLLHWICPGDSLKEGFFIFPKDTNHIMVMYQNKFKIFNLSDFSVEREIYNDTVVWAKPQFARGIEYLIFEDWDQKVSIYNIAQHRIVYRYNPIYLVGYGYGMPVSNNSELIFYHVGNNMLMLNAKYETTSVKLPDDEEPFLIYPNPASDYIEVSGSSVILSEAKSRNGVETSVAHPRIFDLLGMEITTPTLSEGDGVVRLDVSSLSPGVYFVRVGDVVRKFVKM